MAKTPAHAYADRHSAQISFVRDSSKAYLKKLKGNVWEYASLLVGADSTTVRATPSLALGLPTWPKLDSSKPESWAGAVLAELVYVGMASGVSHWPTE